MIYHQSVKTYFWLSIVLILATIPILWNQSVLILYISIFNSSIFFKFLEKSHMISDWLFMQAVLSGKNGYDLQVLKDQCKLISENLTPVARFNPPWYYLFFAPFTYFSLNNFIILLTLLSCLSAIYATERTFQLFGRTKPSPILILTVCIFFSPIIYNLCNGQISNFLALDFVLVLDSFTRKHDKRLGFYLALLSVKPQSTYLIPIAIFASTLREKRYSIICAYILTLTLLITTSFIIFPSAFYFWNQTHFALEIKTFTLSTYIRIALFEITNKLYNWPIFVIPMGTALIVFFAMLKKNYNLHVYSILLPCIAVITAPYGWFYDLSVLIPVICFILLVALEQLKRDDYFLISGWLLINIAGIFGVIYLDYLSLWFFPLIVLILSCCAIKYAPKTV
jgi:hypothetical protein